VSKLFLRDNNVSKLFRHTIINPFILVKLHVGTTLHTLVCEPWPSLLLEKNNKTNNTHIHYGTKRINGSEA